MFKKILNGIVFGAVLFGLTACGGSGSSSDTQNNSSDSSNNAGNTPYKIVPVANAGENQNVKTGVLVTLSGSASSSSDNSALTYEWVLSEKPMGSQATLSSTDAVSPSFFADIDGVYIAQLTVNNGDALSDPSNVKVTASTPNSAPVANAGNDKNVNTGNSITINGSESSDADGDHLFFSWLLKEKPETSSTSLSDTTSSSLDLYVDVDGEYIVQLIVNDGEFDSEPVTIKITASTPNSAPIANAGGAQSVIIGETVILDGSASSDADLDTLSYSWVLKNQPETSTALLYDSESVNPSFTADAKGEYVVSLVVNDGKLDSNIDNVVIKAMPPHMKLYSKSSIGFGSGTYNESSLPYNMNGSSQVNIIGTREDYTLGNFKLKAVGGDFTIINLQVTTSNNTITPYFKDLVDNQVVLSGQEVEFSLVSPMTSNRQINIVFEFEVKETGEKFLSQWVFRTN